ncbi:MAG: undecaprenyldiphospho-muramoylpentapeptide beta-N-acetylglucosaminyltransferase [Bacillota bacterium]|nr:undecaprenyldiphospho-muramoylpentapeptide beta-N-acetylglucosaminyltransferase [Bacillota bacterium]
MSRATPGSERPGQGAPAGGRGRPRKVLVTGGGTGGHIYPALAIARELERLAPERLGAPLEILYVGVAGGMEERLAQEAGYRFLPVAAGGLVGKRPLELLRNGLRMAAGLLQAVALLRRERPHLVVGTGGYAAAPLLAAAVLLRIPAALQEQNAIPGKVNQLLAPWVREVYLAYPEAARRLRGRTFVTGNPVRAEVTEADRQEARRRLGLPPGEALVLCAMGSRGSATVNRVLAELVVDWARRPPERPPAFLLLATGRAHHAAFLEQLARAGVAGEGPAHRVLAYVDEMPQALAAADLAVARAGAISLAELTARGLPAVLVPSPHVAYDHQRANAEALARQGAAVVLEEAELTAGRLRETVERLLGDPARLAAMAAASRRLGRPEAARTLAERLLRLLR